MTNRTSGLRGLLQDFAGMFEFRDAAFVVVLVVVAAAFGAAFDWLT